MTKAVVVILPVLGLAACRVLPFLDGTTAPETRRPSGEALAEFHPISYDGNVLRGRILVGAAGGELVLDRRLVEWAGVELNNVRACGRDIKLAHLVFESLPPPPEAKDLLTLQPGYWFGADLRFLLFDEKLGTEPGPACLEADLAIRAPDFQIAATVPIRATRSGPPSSPAEDAGTTSDAGVNAPP